MTQHNEKTAPEVTASETAKSFLEDGSITTAYLSRWRDNTGHTYGTWSGVDLKIEDHITLIIPIEDAQLIYADGSRLVRINEKCVAAQSKEARKKRDAQEAKKRALHEKAIRAEIEEDFAAEIDALDQQYEKVYQRVDAEVKAILDAEVNP